MYKRRLISLMLALVISVFCVACEFGRTPASGTSGSETSGDGTDAHGTAQSSSETSAEATDAPDTSGSGSAETETSEAGTSGADPTVEPEEFVIFIDPGHGFADTGATSEYLGGYNECDITLMIAKEVVALLQSKGLNAKLLHDGVNLPIASTDNGDDIFSATSAGGFERCVYPNENGVGIFVSLHCDSFPADSRISGTRIHYCDDYGYAKYAADLTGRLVDAIGGAFGGERSVKALHETGLDAYNVTRFINAPSALIEMGFVTNKDDAKSLLDPEWRASMARGVAEGIAAFAAGYARG